MPPTSREPAAHRSYLQAILDESEPDALRRLTALAEHLFCVPVAYLALLDSSGTAVSRIGSGTDYGRFLGKLPLDTALRGPVVYDDTATAVPPDFDWGGLRFAASAPLRSCDGLTLGLLVIADWEARPGFSVMDESALAELAGVLAGKMELRRVAEHALQFEALIRETEGRFRAIANSAPVLMICSGPDGAASFVNRQWLEFTGRALEEETGEGWTERIHPNYRPQVIERYWRAFAAREPFSAEFPMLRHDGMYRWIEGRSIPRFREDGSFAGYVGCSTEISELGLARLSKQLEICGEAVELIDVVERGVPGEAHQQKLARAHFA